MSGAHDTTTVVTVSGAGATVAIDVSPDSPELAEAVRRAWSRAATTESAIARVSAALTVDPTRADVTGTDLHHVMERLTQRVTMAILTAEIGRLLLLHAAALADPVSGRSVVFVAPSRTGKTAVAHTLGDQFAYLTDETVAIDDGLRILPYPKPLSVRISPEKRRELSADELGLRGVPADPTVARLVVLRRSDEHEGQPVATELDDFDAIVALVGETSSLAKLDRPLHRLADLITRTGPVVEFRYREAESLRPLVAGLVAP